MSSFRYSESASLFRRSVLHRIRFGNTLRLKAEFDNAAVSSLRANDLLGGNRRPSHGLAAYPDHWMFDPQHRRLSGSPQSPLPEFVAEEEMRYRTRMSSQKTLDNIPAAFPTNKPNPSSVTSLVVPPAHFDDYESADRAQPSSLDHLPDCAHASQPMHRKARTRSHSQSNLDLSSARKLDDVDSESSSVWTNEGLGVPAGPTSAATGELGSTCTCQLLWQLEKDTDSIDRFKLFFKRDHFNVDWDYVQGSSEV